LSTGVIAPHGSGRRFLSALLIAILSLSRPDLDVVDSAFGYVAYEFKKTRLNSDKDLDDLKKKNCHHPSGKPFTRRVQQTG
jgi:hypothetical protein